MGSFYHSGGVLTAAKLTRDCGFDKLHVSKRTHTEKGGEDEVKGRKIKEKLTKRREGFDNLREKDGRKRPGSMNPRKQA